MMRNCRPLFPLATGHDDNDDDEDNDDVDDDDVVNCPTQLTLIFIFCFFVFVSCFMTNIKVTNMKSREICYSLVLSLRIPQEMPPRIPP